MDVVAFGKEIQCDDRVRKIMNQCVRRFISENKNDLYEIVEEVSSNRETVKDAFLAVSDELFSGGVSWGRIIAFYSFGSLLASRCKSIETDVVKVMDVYTAGVIVPFVLENGGWGQFCRTSGNSY